MLHTLSPWVPIAALFLLEHTAGIMGLRITHMDSTKLNKEHMRLRIRVGARVPVAIRLISSFQQPRTSR